MAPLRNELFQEFLSVCNGRNVMACQSRFSGVYLVFKVFQDIWCSNKENPGALWSATLSCASMASNYANSHLVPISF